MKLGEWIKQGLGLAQSELTARIGDLHEALREFGIASGLDWKDALDEAIENAHRSGRIGHESALRAIKSCMEKLHAATRGK